MFDDLIVKTTRTPIFVHISRSRQSKDSSNVMIVWRPMSLGPYKRSQRA